MKAKFDKAKVIEKQEESDYGDCSCEMIDTSLQGVGDSDCSCSECLEANLEAFNEFKNDQEQVLKENEGKHNRGQSTRIASNKQSRGVSKNTIRRQQNGSKIEHYKSVDKMRYTRPKTTVNRRHPHHDSQADQNYNSNVEISAQNFSRENINDFLIITQHRARQYLKERKNLQKSQMKQRSQLKGLIKQNLEALKYTSQIIRNEKPEAQQGTQQNRSHDYKWNHPPYFCKSRVQCRKRFKYQPDFQRDKEEIQEIEKRIKEYKKQTKEKPYKCPDCCPNHHMRTSKKKIQEVQKFIRKQAKQYQKAQKKAKKEQEQKEKIIQAKLRAIDLKCKEKVAKSKKYDPMIERTSFHNSVDHFSTFSQLKIANLQRLQQKQQRMKAKIARKDGKMMQEAIYQNIQEQMIGDHPFIQMSLNTESRYVNDHQKREDKQEWCQKIVKDARIKPPKELKHNDKAQKIQKEHRKQQQKQKPQSQKNTTKKMSTNNLKKQQQKRKQIQQEINRKKQQILNEFKKRNSNTNLNKNEIKNKPIKEEYSSSNKKQKKNKPEPQDKAQKYDPYRQNYQHHPSNNPQELQAIGDPLIQQFDHHRNNARSKQHEIKYNKEVFVTNGKALMQKKQIKI